MIRSAVPVVDFALLKPVVLPIISDIEPPFQENIKIFTGPQKWSLGTTNKRYDRLSKVISGNIF